MNINMKSPIGIVKQVKVGFSWTMLFFGIFVPLIRGDFKWFGITLLVALLTSGISWFVFPFLYNKLYIKDLLAAGWMPADEVSSNILTAKGIFIPQSEI